jgi:hypothetical protein
MADAAPQTYANHRRFVPLYHGMLIMLTLNIFAAGFHWWRSAPPALFPLWFVVFSFCLVLFGLATRAMAMTLQDRIIRLEMRLRLAELLPADLKARIGELSRSQLVGLRFASDGELPELVRRCLVGELKGAEAVKKEIKTWVPDTLRA